MLKFQIYNCIQQGTKISPLPFTPHTLHISAQSYIKKKHIQATGPAEFLCLVKTLSYHFSIKYL